MNDDPTEPGAAARPPTAAEGSPLATAYRRLLLAYPRRWRAEHGEALVATLLDAADAANPRATPRRSPSAAEAVDILGNGLATRLTGWIPATARAAIASVALATGGVLAATMLVIAEQGYGPIWPFAAWNQSTWPDGETRLGPLQTTGVLVYLPFLVAWGAALAGRRQISRYAALAVWPATAVVLILSATTTLARPPLGLLGTLCLLVPAAVLAPPRVGLPGRRGAGRGTIAVATALVACWVPLTVLFYHFVIYADPLRETSLGGGYRFDSVFYMLSESIPPLFVIAGLVAVAVSVRRPGWLAAVGVTGTALSLLYVVWVRGHNRWTWIDDTMKLGLFVVIMLLLAVIDIHRATTRQGRLPAPTTLV